MKFTKKDVCMFAGGTAIGIVIGGVTVVYKAITSETFGDPIAKALADKMVDSIVGRSDRVSYGRPKQISYRSYYYRNREFDTDILFETWDAANKVRDELLDIQDSYGLATIADLYDLADITGYDYRAAQYGWVNLNEYVVQIKRLKHGYLLKMPKPVPVD